jgi:curved DNA-binding protein
MQYKDYYDILGLDRGADAEAIKSAYRRLARRYHPDVSDDPQAEERFKAVSEAYEVLRDADKRAAYDALGKGWQAGEAFRPPPGWEQAWHGGFEAGAGPGGGFGGFTGAERFSDFFEALFSAGGGRGGASPFATRGQDRHGHITVSVEEAYHGTTRSVQVSLPEPDPSARPTAATRTLQVKIPPGVTRGSRVRLPGQGTPGMGGGARGDLFLEVELAPHPLYRVDGKDLSLDLPVTPWEAALGTRLRVPTPGGPLELKVPAGARSGQRLRVRGRGLPGKEPGDFYVLVQIQNPPDLDAEQRACYERMAQASSYDPRTHLGV